MGLNLSFLGDLFNGSPVQQGQFGMDWANQNLGTNYTQDMWSKLAPTDLTSMRGLYDKMALPQGGLFGLDASGMANLKDMTGMLSGFGGLAMDIGNYNMGKKAFKKEMGEYDRQVRKDKDFSNNISASGLGTYSAG